MRTEKRNYGMVCGVTESRLRGYISSKHHRVERLKPKEDVFSLDSQNFQTISWEGIFDNDDTLDLTASIDSTQQISVFFVTNKTKLKQVISGLDKGIPECFCQRQQARREKMQDTGERIHRDT